MSAAIYAANEKKPMNVEWSAVLFSENINAAFLYPYSFNEVTLNRRASFIRNAPQHLFEINI